MRDLVGFLKVISCAVCVGTVKILFSASATQHETNLVDQLTSGVQFVLVIEILGKAEGALRARNDGEFEKRISAFQEPRNHSVS
jgi:hypothetical protein